MDTGKKPIVEFKDEKKGVGVIMDGLMNSMSGLGTTADKGSFGSFVKRTQRTYQELGVMFTDTSICRKIVSIIPGDMTREWRTFEDTELTPEQIKDYERAEKFYSLKKKVREAMMWARLYGGALIVPILDNGDSDLTKPLELKSVKKGSLKGFTVMDAKYAPATGIITQDPTSTNYLKPELYTITGAGGTAIHHSRVIRFDGLPLPREEYQRNRYWHQSVLDSVYKEITNATLVSDSIAALMHELNLDIVNIKGLSNALASGQEEIIKKRFEVYAFAKSMFHMAILDEEETFTNRTMPASGGIDNLISKFYGLLAAVTDIPATRFMGESPGGLNATGESDMRNYYDNIKDKQECDLSPNMFILDEIIARSLWGDTLEAIHDYSWVKLWQESEAEQATREYQDAQRDQIYLTNGVVTEAQVAEELMQNKVYSNIEPSYIKELEELANLAEEDFSAPNQSNTPASEDGAKQEEEEEL